MSSLTIGFIGLGLIGGSIARTIKSTHPDYNLVVYDHHNKSYNNDISMAIERKVIDYATNDLTFFKNCRLVFLCCPVMINIDYLASLKNIIGDDTIITDVGSVKGNIHEAVTALGLSSNFIGGHPMTGSEKTGFTNSSETLLENAYYILTPTKEVSTDKIDFITSIVKDMRSIPITLEYKEHDKVTAAISHLPHIIASSLVNLVEESDDEKEHMRYLAAGGFKDITRIASASPTIWQNICLTNDESIIYYLEQYINSLNHMKSQLEQKNSASIYHFFENAREYRNALPKDSKGLGIPLYEIYLDLQDVTGAIARVANLLADNSISIKNIGIIHNREFEEGVLRIEFYNDIEKGSATTLLKEYDYNIYER